MGRTISIGNQSFESIRNYNNFYIDKTGFIKEWWENDDSVTLITRPRRFGKTLNMSMLECFFSIKYANKNDMFDGLEIWKEEKYRNIQGTFPVIFVTFAGVKGNNYISAIKGIKQQIISVCDSFSFLLDWDGITESEKKLFNRTMNDISDDEAAYSLLILSGLLERYHKKRVLQSINLAGLLV